MKVTAILGSPNPKGTTATMAGAFLSKARELGAETTTYPLNQMKFQGCQGCYVCKSKQEFCVLKDDLTPALEAMQKSDIMVFATPIYYWDVTGQFKCFVDRTWSLVKPDYMTNPDPVRIEKGKKAIFITSQQAVEEKHKDVSEKYMGFLKMYGFQTESLRAFGITSDSKLDGYIDKAKELASRML